MDKYVHGYLKQHKGWQDAWKVIQLLKLELHKTMERVLKEKNFFFLNLHGLYSGSSYACQLAFGYCIIVAVQTEGCLQLHLS